jgi:hypothetical protein
VCSSAGEQPLRIVQCECGPEAQRALVCCFFRCDLRLFNPLLQSLPRFIRCRQETSIASRGECN